MKSYIKIKKALLLFNKKRNLIAIIGLLLLMSFSRTTENNSFETIKNIDIFHSLYKELNLYYVDDIVPGEIIKKGIDAMLASLDPYTNYIPESQTESLKIMTTGKYGGIGALIQKRDNYTMISNTYENCPAAKAGLIPGDIILEIEGKSMQNKNSEELSELLRGAPKTKVKLKIKKLNADKPVDIIIEREEIKMPTIPYHGMLNNSVGYISLHDFTNTATKEVKDALLNLKKNNELKTLILDLRGNPGGLMMEAVTMCNLFVEKNNKVVSMKGKIAQMDKDYKASDSPIDKDIKIIVLVDRASASSSEIVAGCFQDLDRAVIVGERTFGKGLVQTTRELPYNGILKVTTAKYYTPSGRCIQTLDYSHRNPDGSVSEVPDSLISEFKTKNGRKVYDGGGINPDVIIKEREINTITVDLILNNLIFDFANLYKLKHENIDSPDKFSISDSDYDDFVKFVQGKDFKYKTNTEELLSKLIEETKKEKYYDIAQSDLEVLSTKIKETKNSDIIKHKGEITEILNSEIISRYYYDRGTIIFELKNDPAVKKAIEIAADDNEYNRILKPSK